MPSVLLDSAFSYKLLQTVRRVSSYISDHDSEKLTNEFATVCSIEICVNLALRA